METLRIFIRAFRQLTFDKILRLLKLGLGNPFLMLLSGYATVKAYNIAKKSYPKSSSANGVGNAFRHALWCCLITSYCCKIHAPQKALKWCKKLTDLHEDIFPNPPLQKAMDLHNNALGMALFQQMLPGIHRQFFENTFFIEALQPMVENAVWVENIEDFPKNKLVYIER